MYGKAHSWGVVIAIVVMCLTVDHVSAHIINTTLPLPGIDEVCFSVTNYWPFDENGEIVAHAGQADSDPYHTAAMVDVRADREMEWVAAPLPLLNDGASIKLPWLAAPLPVLDTFGDEDYQAGVFWHDGYKAYVIGVDLFTSTPVHYLECGGEVVFSER